MENVIRVERFEQLDRKVIPSKYPPIKEVPDLEEIMLYLSYCIKAVYVKGSKPDESDGIFLGCTYDIPSTWRKKAKGAFPTDLMVFPVGRETLDYELHKNDFLVNQGADPIRIQGLYQSVKNTAQKDETKPYAIIADLWLFWRNPFLHHKKYEDEINGYFRQTKMIREAQDYFTRLNP